MSITVKPMHPDFVTEISGVDLARPLTPADRDAIEDAINRYAIVVFHDQTLTDEQQIDFPRHFGPIHSSAQKARHTGIKHRIASHDIADTPSGLPRVKAWRHSKPSFQAVTSTRSDSAFTTETPTPCRPPEVS